MTLHMLRLPSKYATRMRQLSQQMQASVFWRPGQRALFKIPCMCVSYKNRTKLKKYSTTNKTVAEFNSDISPVHRKQSKLPKAKLK